MKYGFLVLMCLITSCDLIEETQILNINNTQTNNEYLKIKNDIFTVHYSEKLEQPLYLEYNVKCTETIYDRDGLDFYKEDNINTSDNKDYENNDYDKGHLAPAASFACNKKDLEQTFSYLNCALQHKDLNRGVWKELEIYERKLALKNKVYIVIEVIFSKNSKKLKSGATIPDGFSKTIKYKGITEKYYFDNCKPIKKGIKNYIVVNR